MISGERWRLGHRPALDGLRGIAIALVLIQHSQVPGFRISGQVGVCLFFVLSGFLITSLLVEQHQRTGRISLKAFYARRFRRLAPAFLATIGIIFVFATAVAGSAVVIGQDVLLSLSYVGNWALAEQRHAGLGVLSGTWSLAVEEQFYLVWPLVVIWVLRRGSRRLTVVAAVGILLSLTARGVLVAHGAAPVRIYYGTDTNAAALLAGALLAAHLHQTARPRRARGSAVVGVGALGLLSTLPTGAAWTWAGPMAVAVSVALVWTCATSAPTGLSARWLRWLGSRSYAIYLWNCAIAATVYFVPMPWPERSAIVVLPSLLLAALSWRWIESPFMRSRPDAGADGVLVRRRREGVAADVGEPRAAGARVEPV